MSMSEFAEFLAGTDEIEDKGEVQLRGKATTHYQGRVSAREVAEKTGGETAKRFEEALARPRRPPPARGLDRRAGSPAYGCR